MRDSPAPPLGGYAPAGSYGPSALRPRFALPPGTPQGFRSATPLALCAHPMNEPPKGAVSPWSLYNNPPVGKNPLPKLLPSPPPLPAGKGSESPSVVRGAGHAALCLLLLPPAGERWVVPKESRVRFALRGGPCPRLRLRAAPATPTALDPFSTPKPHTW